MAVKMPVLGQQSRRKSGGLGWLLLLVLAVAAGGYLWHRKHRPAPPVAQVPVVAPAPVISAPGSTVVPGVAQAPVPPPVQTGPRFLSVRIDGPLEAALVAGAGTDTGPALTQVVKRILVWWIAVPADLRKGDVLEVVYEPQPGQAEPGSAVALRGSAGVPPGRGEPLVHAVRLQSAKAGRTFEAYRFKPAGAQFARFYEPDGGDLELRLDPSPLDSWEQITSLLKDGRKHRGVDFKTPVGTAVKATFDGTITRKNWAFRGNGNSLEVTEAGAPHMKAVFLHLSELPRTLTVGTRVKKGEVIAHSGNSGHSFAPHLHYQLMSASDRVLDPFDVHPTRKVSLPATDRQALTEQVAKWRSMMTARVAATPGPALQAGTPAAVR
ncbi:MAG TPA: peptidoglycan DD-metalloendopeptidase family protein [Myxococcaceae bacterium]|nr:peptidoglycan DD-metalloendopeptidase family protein [Myxococcaceae bacterium]